MTFTDKYLRETASYAPASVFRYGPEEVLVGASFGNEACFMRSNAAAGIDHIWMAATGAWYFGQVDLRYREGTTDLSQTDVVFEPVSVVAEYALHGLTVQQRVFVAAGRDARAYLWVRFQNDTPTPRVITVGAQGLFRASPSLLHRRQPAPEDLERLFRQVNRQQHGRLVMAGPGREVLSIITSTPEAAWAETDGSWKWEEVLSIGSREVRDVWLCLDIQPDSSSSMILDASQAYQAVLTQALTDTSTAAVGTPVPPINAGVFWGKNNTRRVFHRFHHGVGFTNDPPGNLFVTRDAAWLTFGADFFSPELTREMLDTLTVVGPYPDGKIAEYVDLNAVPLDRRDYGLNIADPTPLYLLAVYHHAAATGDTDWLRRTFPVVRAAADYLLSQLRNDLVVCTSRRTEPGLGVSGWRNVLNGINISGATAELQAECVAALAAAAVMALALGEGSAASRFDLAARRMHKALLQELVDVETGRFRLALDPDEPQGGYGKDDTLDQVFPVLFGLADEELARRTMRHLFGDTYRTPRGLRTVPITDPGYHPSDQWGLIGGVWPNASAWVAAAAAAYFPEEGAAIAADVARTLFPRTPRELGASVPGQFPEWLDGETGESKGMALSPWMPATYVWLIIERILGITPTMEGLTVQPQLPPTWTAAFVRQLRYRQRHVSLLISREAVYSTETLLKCDRDVRLCTDVTEDFTGSPGLIVLRHGSTLVAYRVPETDAGLILPSPLHSLKPGEFRVLST